MTQVRFAPATNSADWQVTGVVRDAYSGDVVDLTDCSIKIVLQMSDGHTYPDYGNYWRYADAPALSGSTDDGTVTIPDPENGVVQWLFRATQMGTLCAGFYDVGALMQRDGATTQVFLGTLPVRNGIARP